MTDKDQKPEPAATPADDNPAEAPGAAQPAREAAEGSGEDSQSAWSSAKAAELTAGEFEKLSQENAELKERLLRTMAEMENMRRRTERDKADTAKYAISNFARDVLGVGDNIRRAIESVPEGAAQADPALQALLEGVELTERELLNAMERHGITRVEPKGERFDPNRHQAMYEVEDASVEAGTIVELLQAGYQIADRVLRPAMVGVSKGGPKQTPADMTTPGGEKAAAGEAPGTAAETASPAQPDAEGEKPVAASDAGPAKEAASRPRQGRKTPLPDPSRAPSAASRDSGQPNPGARRPVGRHVDKSA